MVEFAMTITMWVGLNIMCIGWMRVVVIDDVVLYLTKDGPQAEMMPTLDSIELHMKTLERP